MSSTTPTLRLTLTGTSSEDKDLLFETWRTQMSGEDATSNMQIIDAAIAEDRARIKELEDNGVKAEGYVQTVNNQYADECGNVSLTANDVGALYIDKTEATTGSVVPTNADTLGGIPADQYVQKGDIGSFESGVPAGGAVGQILSKASDDDYDMVWIDPPIAEQSPTDPGNADTLDGKTLAEIKNEIKNEIMTDGQLDADTVGGKSLAEVKTEIKAEILQEDIDADTIEGKTLSEIVSDLQQSGSTNATTLDGKTFEQIKTAILSEVVYQ